ncbi:hypothetical protein LTR85_002849 [Meristemomyces frigidus]|nr:hypothetical protein LTR85_002849 [Meristemomyces frigidus]
MDRDHLPLDEQDDDDRSDVVREDEEDDEYAVNKAGEMVNKEVAGRRILAKEQYWSVMGGKWREPGLAYELETFAVTGHYEGRDKPKPKDTRCYIGAREKRFEERDPCVIVFRDWADESTGQGYSVGNLIGSATKQCIFSGWSTNSQNPGLKLHIIERDGDGNELREIVCSIPVAAMQRNQKHEVDLRFRWGHNSEIRDTVSSVASHSQLTEKAYTDDLFEIDVQFWDFDNQVPFLKSGPAPVRPKFNGISTQELERIRDKAMEWNLPSDFEMTIGMLLMSKRVSIFRDWPSSAGKAAENWDAWWRTAVFLTAKYGEMWHYQRQLDDLGHNESVFSHEIDLSQLRPARNMAIDWLGEFDANGNPRGNPQPHRLAAYVTSKNDLVYGHPRVMSLQLRIGVERSRQMQSHILNSAFKVNAFEIIGRFHVHKNRTGVYVVDLRLPTGTLLNEDRSLRVKPDAKLTMHVKPVPLDMIESRTASKEDFDSAPILTYMGVTAEDIFNSGAEVTAIIQGRDLAEVVDITHGAELCVSIEMKDDATPTGRYQAAIQEIEIGMRTRTKGVDIPAIVLRAPQTILQTNSLAAELNDSAWPVIVAVVNAFGLNDRQRAAMENSANSLSGLLAIWGPPGCGKSWLMAAIAYMQIRTGRTLGKRRPVLCCAPTNIAVEAVMTHFLAGTQGGKRDGLDLEIVRYKGSLLREDLKEKKPVKDADGDLEMETAADAEAEAEAPANDEAQEAEEAEVDDISEDEAEDEAEAKGEDQVDEDEEMDDAEDKIAKADAKAAKAEAKAAKVAAKAAKAARREAKRLREEEKQAAEMREALWELADESNPFGHEEAMAEYGFYRKRKAWIVRASESLGSASESEMAPIARQYLDKRTQVNTPGALNKKDRKDHKAELEGLEEDLTDYYLGNVVDIVFCTNSSSAHGILRDAYKPKVLMSDEAATASIPDTATPAGAFIDTIEHWVMCGDHMQQKPVVASKGRNEWSSPLEISLFESVVELRLYSDFYVMLDTQHRMHPELAAPLVIWYHKPDGTPMLKNHPSTLGQSDVWDRLEDFLSGLGKAFNHRRRVVFDISGIDEGGRTIASSKNGTSYTNEVEAREVASFIKAAIGHTGSNLPGRDLQQSDFLILSPYKAQVSLINQILFKNGACRTGNPIACHTMRNIQGGDGPIVVQSMGRNVPKKPTNTGFTGESGLQSVGASRAKNALLLFGNYLALIQAQLDGIQNGKKTILDPRTGKLKEGIFVAYEDYKKWFYNHEAPDVSLAQSQMRAKAQPGRGHGFAGPAPKNSFALKEAANFRQMSQRSKEQRPPQPPPAKKKADLVEGVEPVPAAKGKARRSKKKKNNPGNKEEDAREDEDLGGPQDRRDDGADGAGGAGSAAAPMASAA